MPEGDPFDLERFVAGQEGVYSQVVAELRRGRKTSHWVWFIFPQLRGLGRSDTAHRYGIASLAEAHAYLAHPVLGPRLRECVGILLEQEDRSAHDILRSPDDMKLRSCLTLFMQVAPDEPLFSRGLQKYFDGTPDPLTLDRLAAADR